MDQPNFGKLPAHRRGHAEQRLRHLARLLPRRPLHPDGRHPLAGRIQPAKIRSQHVLLRQIRQPIRRDEPLHRLRTGGHAAGMAPPAAHPLLEPFARPLPTHPPFVQRRELPPHGCIWAQSERPLHHAPRQNRFRHGDAQRRHLQHHTGTADGREAICGRALARRKEIHEQRQPDGPELLFGTQRAASEGDLLRRGHGQPEQRLRRPLPLLSRRGHLLPPGARLENRGLVEHGPAHAHLH